jgi:hypothetical protein
MAAAVRFYSAPFDGFNLSCVLIVPLHRRVAVQIHDGTPPKINADYHVYVAGKDGDWHFSITQFEGYRACAGIDWPRHEATGKLDLRRKTFMSKAGRSSRATPVPPRSRQDAAHQPCRRNRSVMLRALNAGKPNPDVTPRKSAVKAVGSSGEA